MDCPPLFRRNTHRPVFATWARLLPLAALISLFSPLASFWQPSAFGSKGTVKRATLGAEPTEVANRLFEDQNGLFFFAYPRDIVHRDYRVDIGVVQRVGLQFNEPPLTIAIGTVHRKAYHFPKCTSKEWADAFYVNLKVIPNQIVLDRFSENGAPWLRQGMLHEKGDAKGLVIVNDTTLTGDYLVSIIVSAPASEPLSKITARLDYWRQKLEWSEKAKAQWREEASQALTESSIVKTATHWAEAIQHRQAGRYQEALSLLLTFPPSEAENVLYLEELFTAYYKLERHEEAIDAGIELAFRKQSNLNELPLLSLEISILAQQGRLWKLFDTYIEREPTSAKTATLLCMEVDVQYAIQDEGEVKTLLQKHPTSSLLWMRLGRNLMTQGRPVAGVKAFSQALAIDQSNPMIWAYYAGALLEKGEIKEAIATAEKGTKVAVNQKGETHLGIFVIYASALEKDGQVAKAISIHRDILALQPNFIGSIKPLLEIGEKYNDEPLRLEMQHRLDELNLRSTKF